MTIQISINIEIFLFIIIFIITKQIGLYIVFILLVLLHELAHTLTGIALGVKPKQFMIMPFGFKIVFEDFKNTRNIEIKKIIIALSGPAINIFLMIISIILNLHKNIIYTNLIIALFNLIPIYPLDGGRILKSVLRLRFDWKQAYNIVNKISNITVIILTSFSSIAILQIKNIGIVFALAYLWYIVIRENKRYKIIRKIYDIKEMQKL